MFAIFAITAITLWVVNTFPIDKWIDKIINKLRNGANK